MDHHQSPTVNSSSTLAAVFAATTTSTITAAAATTKTRQQQEVEFNELPRQLKHDCRLASSAPNTSLPMLPRKNHHLHYQPHNNKDNEYYNDDATQQNRQDDDDHLWGEEYYVKVKGLTPNHNNNSSKPINIDNNIVDCNSQENKRVQQHTHSDPDTFQVFSSSENSTFGKSNSYAFLELLAGEENANISNGGDCESDAAGTHSRKNSNNSLYSATSSANNSSNIEPAFPFAADYDDDENDRAAAASIGLAFDVEDDNNNGNEERYIGEKHLDDSALESLSHPLASILSS